MLTGNGGRIFCMKMKRNYLGIVAHECHISAISRQLVVIGLFFFLWGGSKSVTHSHTDLGGFVVFRLSACSILLTETLQTCLCPGTLWNYWQEHCARRQNPGISSDTRNLWRMRKAFVRSLHPSGNIITMLKCNCHICGLTYKLLALNALCGANEPGYN